MKPSHSADTPPNPPNTSYDATFGDSVLASHSQLYREAKIMRDDPNEETRQLAQKVTQDLGTAIVRRLSELDVVELRHSLSPDKT